MEVKSAWWWRLSRGGPGKGEGRVRGAGTARARELGSRQTLSREGLQREWTGPHLAGLGPRGLPGPLPRCPLSWRRCVVLPSFLGSPWGTGPHGGSLLGPGCSPGPCPERPRGAGEGLREVCPGIHGRSPGSSALGRVGLGGGLAWAGWDAGPAEGNDPSHPLGRGGAHQSPEGV